MQLRKISLLNPEELAFNKIMQELGYDLRELSDNKLNLLIFYIMDPNKSPFREFIRSQAIHTLGKIGQQQKLPMYVVNYIRDLMFEMRNPNIRPHVVVAFTETVALHPYTPTLMKRLTLRMKELREQNTKARKRHQTHFRLQTKERGADHSFKSFGEGEGLHSSYLENQDENEKIYRLLEQVARKELLPRETVNELALALALALDADRTPRFTVMDFPFRSSYCGSQKLDSSPNGCSPFGTNQRQ